MKKSEGFAPILILVVVVFIIVISVVWLKLAKNQSNNPDTTNPFTNTEILQTQENNNLSECPDILIFSLPIDISLATSILYPGQIRAGDYKAHGGFRFDNSLPNEILVVAPIDAKVIAGARYPANTGDIQYTFDFENNCKIRYRLGHLLTLSPKFLEIAQQFPMPKGLDSRTTQVFPPIEVKKGEVIATAVGMTKNGNSKNGTNTFLDWGVYDYRQKNEASNNLEWLANHQSETYQHSVCWFEWITPEDKIKVLALPSADTQSGKTSDYCTVK